MSLLRVTAGALLLLIVPRLAIAQGGIDTIVTWRPARPPSVRTFDRDSAQRNRELPPVTEEHIRTAFLDSSARGILDAARKARWRQDSALVSYNVRGYQRLSLGASLSEQGRERLAYRREGVVRILWNRDAGALVEVEGARAAVPILDHASMQRDANRDARYEMMRGSIRPPYVPGRESLWFGEGIPDATELDFAHPFALGAEAGYKYARGDSAKFRLPDGKVIPLVELKVMPRSPKWYLVVGSFWFDENSYRVVRAAYRPSVPVDYLEILAPEDKEEIPLLIRPFLNPVRGTIEAVTVEYALYETQFWLPTMQTMTAVAQASFLRIPLKYEQRYEYLSVNGHEQVPALPISRERAYADSIRALALLLWQGDSSVLPKLRELNAAQSAERRTRGQEMNAIAAGAGRGDSSAIRLLDSLRTEGLMPGCNSSGFRTQLQSRYNGALRLRSTVTCNDSLLQNSPHLPPSIFDENGAAADDASGALESLLSMGFQARFAPRLPSFGFGLGDGLARYNRVEGFSPALRIRQELGAGFSADALVRAGTADHELNGELQLRRSNGRRSVRVAGFRRLVASNDWGSPLSAGASLQTLLFGRDEGFYYRTHGVELAATATGNPALEWRVFAERQGPAVAAAEFSLAKSLNGVRFRENIAAQPGGVFGTAARLRYSLGQNPAGFRVLSELKVENGLGDFGFSRAVADVTFSQGVPGLMSAALTLSGGSSAGELPVQRRFQLGGMQSIRGLPPGAASGDAFWMARAELGTSKSYLKPIVFADIGWAGSKERWRHPGQLLSAAGVGVSFFDGMLRMDLARGINPTQKWRFGLYAESRF